MSTIRVNAIQHTTANDTNMTLFANGNIAMTTANALLRVGNTTIFSSGIVTSINMISTTSSITGTTSLTNSSFGILYQCSGTSANYAITLPAVSGNAGKVIGFQMSTALTRLVTITGSGSETIDGSNTRIMWAGETAILYCDGSSWTKIGGKTIPMVAGQYKGGGGSQTVSTGTATKITLGTNAAVNCPAAMNDTTNNRVVIVRPGNYSITSSTRTQNNPVSFGGQEVLLYKNGSELWINSKYSTSGDWSPIQVSGIDTGAVNDYYETYARQYSGQNATYFVNIMNNLYVAENPQW